jgi:hypothetical protein
MDFSGHSIISQHLPMRYRTLTSRGADDFSVPSGRWTVTVVVALGSLPRRAKPINSENVVFYHDRDGAPGSVIARFNDIIPLDPGSGRQRIPLTSGVTLGAGTYWVSVQVTKPYSYWLWKTTSDANGASAKWKNPLDGFGSGCTDWSDVGRCGVTEGPGFMFVLRGTASY